MVLFCLKCCSACSATISMKRGSSQEMSPGTVSDSGSESKSCTVTCVSAGADGSSRLGVLENTWGEGGTERRLSPPRTPHAAPPSSGTRPHGRYCAQGTAQSLLSPPDPLSLCHGGGPRGLGRALGTIGTHRGDLQEPIGALREVAQA